VALTGVALKCNKDPADTGRILDRVPRLNVMVEPDGLEPTTSTMPLNKDHRKSNGIAGHKRAKAGTEKQ
jgi:hypothetical protein